MGSVNTSAFSNTCHAWSPPGSAPGVEVAKRNAGSIIRSTTDSAVLPRLVRESTHSLLRAKGMTSVEGTLAGLTEIFGFAGQRRRVSCEVGDS